MVECEMRDQQQQEHAVAKEWDNFSLKIERKEWKITGAEVGGGRWVGGIRNSHSVTTTLHV